MTDLITTGEAARLLGVATTTIRSYARRGHLAAVPIDGRTKLYRRAEVEALAANKPKPGRPPSEEARRRLAAQEPGR